MVSITPPLCSHCLLNVVSYTSISHIVTWYFFSCEQGRHFSRAVDGSLILCLASSSVFFFLKIMAVYFNKTIFNIAIYSMSTLHTRCNSASHPPRGANTKSVHQVVHLRQPVVFLNTREEWNFSLWSSSKVELLHPEWGMITVLVRVVKASRMIVILTASHDDRFHSTPAGDNMGVEKTGMPTSGYVSCHV